MDDSLFRRLWSAMDAGAGAGLLARLEEPGRTARLAALPDGLATELQELMRYPLDSAGHLMDPAVTVFNADETAQTALARIRLFPTRRIHDLCVVDSDGWLSVVVPLQEVAVADPEDLLSRLATGPPVHVQAMSSRTEVVELLEQHRLASLPVVSFDGRLRGIIRHDALLLPVVAGQSGNTGAQAMAWSFR